LKRGDQVIKGESPHALPIHKRKKYRYLGKAYLTEEKSLFSEDEESARPKKAQGKLLYVRKDELKAFADRNTRSSKEGGTGGGREERIYSGDARRRLAR